MLFCDAPFCGGSYKGKYCEDDNGVSELKKHWKFCCHHSCASSMCCKQEKSLFSCSVLSKYWPFFKVFMLLCIGKGEKYVYLIEDLVNVVPSVRLPRLF